MTLSDSSAHECPSSTGLESEQFGRWLSVEQIRKMQRMRRTTVIAAMESGELPYERRGRIRYARLADVLIWEQHRLSRPVQLSTRPIDPALADLL